MFIKSTLVPGILAVSMIVGLSFGSQSVHADVTTNLIDFVFLNDGHSIDERNAYELKLSPIAAKFGAKVVHSYDITSHLAGPLKGAVRVNVWEMPEPSPRQPYSRPPTLRSS